MNRRKFFILSSLFLVGILWCKKTPWSSKKEVSFFLPLPIEGWGPGCIPYYGVEIEGHKFLGKMDLGLGGFLSVPSPFFRLIHEKELLGHTVRLGVRGTPRLVEDYKVKKVTLGGIDFTPERVQVSHVDFEKETSVTQGGSLEDRATGRIGWRLFEPYKLLIDCRRGQCALLDSLDTMKKQGYSVEEFVETELVMSCGLLAFKAMTDKGPVLCVLDTGCTRNMYNDLSEERTQFVCDLSDRFEMSTFQVGGNELAPLIFTKMRSPLPCEVLLGMEFFLSAVVVIDFPEKKLYLYRYR